jgi:hypothetical protein
MNAWLLTWEGTKYPANSDKDKIVAVLPGRMASSTVEIIADLLYTRCVWSAGDLLKNANKTKARYLQFRHVYSQPSRFFYGHNPCIFARIVTDMKVQQDEEACTELVRWTELSYSTVERSGELPVEVEPPKSKELTRELGPIAREIYGHFG